MKTQYNSAEPAEKVQTDGRNEQLDSINSIVNSIQEMNNKLEQVHQKISNINDCLSETIENLQIISSLVEKDYTNNVSDGSSTLPSDGDFELEAMKIFYSMEKDEHLFFQFLISKESFNDVLRSEYIRDTLAKEIGSDRLALYKSIEKKLGTKSYDDLIKKGRRLLETVDDYSYNVYSGGLSKDYVEKMIGSLAEESSLAA